MARKSPTKILVSGSRDAMAPVFAALDRAGIKYSTKAAGRNTVILVAEKDEARAAKLMHQAMTSPEVLAKFHAFLRGE